jgi:hypothetical protein
MKLLRSLFLLCLLITGLAWLSQSAGWKRTKAIHKIQASGSYPPNNDAEEKLQQKVIAAKSFVKQKNYNQQFCFLIDMTLHSGQKRFFIYDLKKDSVIKSGLVAHGNCFEYWLEGRKYSNVVGSGCTSLGKYKIGIPYTGKFGYSYKLHGLDSTNNKAYERTVVLHGHSCISDEEVTDDICQSNGCPTVSPGFLLTLKNIINNSGKPVLLWIYD